MVYQKRHQGLSPGGEESPFGFRSNRGQIGGRTTYVHFVPHSAGPPVKLSCSDPVTGVHVPAVETGKAKHLCEEVVEQVPILNLAPVDLDVLGPLHDLAHVARGVLAHRLRRAAALEAQRLDQARIFRDGEAPDLVVHQVPLEDVDLQHGQSVEQVKDGGFGDEVTGAVQQAAILIMARSAQIRNPKSEIRNPKEIRDPKADSASSPFNSEALQRFAEVRKE